MKTYRGMYKMYFDMKGRQAAAEMAMSLHDSVSAIAPNFDVNGAPSFIVYCDEILHELCAIRNQNQLIDFLSTSLPAMARRQFLRQAMIEEIHQTNEMENIHSTRKEIQDEILVIENGRKGKRFDGMIRKYYLLAEKRMIPLDSCQDVRNLYDSFVLDEVVKENPQDEPDGIYFRKSPVSLVKREQVIHQGVYPETALNEAMEHALSFLNDGDYDPLIRIAAFHYMFGYIHPFYNGNGRMTRFISSCRLAMENVHLLVALRLSYVIKSHRTKYYEMFKTTNDKRNFGDITCFVIEFLRFISEASGQVLDFLNEKRKLISHYGQVIDQLPFDNQAKKVLFILAQVSVCESSSLNIAQLARAADVSRYIAEKSMQELAQLCISARKGNSTLYRADLEKLDSLDDT